MKEIKQAIESPKPPACFIFIAYELLLAEECIKEIKNKYINKELEEFNFDLLHGWETNYNEICQRCLTLPLMSSYRLLIVKEAEKIEDSYIDSLKNYLKNPSPTTILILLYSSTSKKGAFTLLKKNGHIYYFNVLSERRLEEWINNQIHQRGYRINTNAIHYILDQTGNDMIKISKELNKIILAQGDKKEISLEDLQSLIGRSQRYNAFNLADAIGKKRASKALKMLHRLIEDGEEPLKILGALQFQFRLLLKVKHLLEKKRDDIAIMNELRMNKLKYSKLKEQSRLFSLSELSQTFQFFYQTDLLLKSSQLKAHFHLEQLVLKLLTKERISSIRV